MRAVTIDQSGFGHQPGISQPTFENCDFGIYADQIELKSDENVMMGLGTGYHSQFSRKSTIISNNFIDAFDDGIDLFMFDMAEILQINNNEIVFGDVSNGSSYSWAIRAEGQNLSTSDMHFIYENTIHFRQQGLNSFGGIYSNATNGLNIIDNRLFMDNNHNNHDGIYMSGCNNIKTLCNDNIRGDGINYDKTTQSSIAIFNGDDAVIACNDMDGTDNGIFVLGNITNRNTH